MRRWTEYVKNGGNLVLTCRTGHKDRNGRLFEVPFRSKIDNLTGNKVDFYDLLLPEDPGKVAMDGKKYNWNTWGEMLIPGKDTDVWASYTDEFYEGKPAVTMHRLGKGTVTYVGVDSNDGTLEKDVLTKLYSTLNIPVMDLPYGVTMEYRNGLGIVLNYSDKPYEFQLPKGRKVLIGETKIPTAGVLVFK
jgi:beta-galactosidase